MTKISTQIGAPYLTGTVVGELKALSSKTVELEAIRSNTGKVCQEVGGIACKIYTP